MFALRFQFAVVLGILRLGLGCIGTLGLYMVCWAGDVAESPPVSFTRDIRPILVANCFQCHGMDETARQAELRLDSFSDGTKELPSGATAIVPGHPASSALIARVCSPDEAEVMPPPDTKLHLSSHEKKLLESWIAAGAEYEQHWAFVPPVLHKPPVAEKGKNWTRNEIDNFILEGLTSRGLQPAEEADRQVLVRRVYYDLIGLPPSPSQVRDFMEDDTPQAYEQLVDRLLENPRYGERWARYWLDLVRYADTAGFEGDPEYHQAWRYRDYVIDAFNDDKPYIDFIKQQIAGDELVQITAAAELPIPDPEAMVAMTFLRLAPFTEPRGAETRDLVLSEMTSTVGSVFLGLTVGCAKCHDHKYDQIPTKDFYRMKAFFATVQITPPARGDIFQIGGTQPAAFYRPGEKDWADQLRADYEQQIADAQREFEEFKDHLREQLTKAEGLDDPVDDERILAEIKNRESEIVTPEIRNRYWDFEPLIKNLQLKLNRLAPRALSLRHTFGPPYEPGPPASYVLIRGEFDRLGEVVKPGFLSAISGHQLPAEIPLDPFQRWPTRGWRKTLAEWIASEGNPLTSRVMVNRLWQQHFGRGIVTTMSDFGSLGSPPSHPELLDWLACYFSKEGWSMKKMHRLMVTSATYRQTSKRNDEVAQQVDPENKLLWQFRRRRLEGEEIRDSVLAVSGRLNIERVGGLPVFPPLPSEISNTPKVYNHHRWRDDHGPEGRRRSIYVFQQRSNHVPLLETFDAFVPDTTCSRRQSTVTALQSLAMYNGRLVNTELPYLADHVRKEAEEDASDQIRRTFQVVLSRSPNEEEIQKSLEFLAVAEGDDPLVGLCRVLLNSNEFLYVD